VHYPFRPHSDFWYLTGFTEPEAVAVFSKEGYSIFLRDHNPMREIWDGKRLGVANAPQTLNADYAYPISELKTQLPEKDNAHRRYATVLDWCLQLPRHFLQVGLVIFFV
jgi:Xaa-Pro aminopeptidase